MSQETEIARNIYSSAFRDFLDFAAVLPLQNHLFGMQAKMTALNIRDHMPYPEAYIFEIDCTQTKRIDVFIAAKRRTFRTYRHGLRTLPVSLNTEPTECQNAYWMPTIAVDERILA